MSNSNSECREVEHELVASYRDADFRTCGMSHVTCDLAQPLVGEDVSDLEIRLTVYDQYGKAELAALSFSCEEASRLQRRLTCELQRVGDAKLRVRKALDELAEED